ncbi:hypothetical protein PD5205_02749 [Xanthomonas fragariae]|uniref:Uncharacterized protein n=1 Tax=Xanthomonas fragariae TaxID=48664 RepID=A0A1Y6H576_9XANT|nr:hypothetical protein PD885_01246 [Xanthomonas fragariae]SMR04039.1 hypothetical protein PD5205_02749 [Xanthomonas fragariae]
MSVMRAAFAARDFIGHTIFSARNSLLLTI